jgi:hypothetical protein
LLARDGFVARQELMTPAELARAVGRRAG